MLSLKDTIRAKAAELVQTVLEDDSHAIGTSPEVFSEFFNNISILISEITGLPADDVYTIVTHYFNPAIGQMRLKFDSTAKIDYSVLDHYLNQLCADLEVKD